MTVDSGVLPGFVAVILLFLLPPGPDMAYMIAVGLQGGRRAAVRAILGIGTGMSIYAASVVVGVGALVRAVPLLLDLVKVIGAAYLLWLAFTTIRHARRASGYTTAATRTSAGRRWYLRGVTVSLSNPKLILFFLAVLPQFLGHAQSATWQLAMLGAVNVGAEVLLYGTIGVLAGTLHERLGRSRKADRVMHYASAAVYAALAMIVTGEVVLAHTGGW